MQVQARYLERPFPTYSFSPSVGEKVAAGRMRGRTPTTTQETPALNGTPASPYAWRTATIGEVCAERTGTRDPRDDPESSFRYVDISSVDNQRKIITEDWQARLVIVVTRLAFCNWVIETETWQTAKPEQCFEELSKTNMHYIPVPVFIPPLITAIVAVSISRWRAGPLAYIAGSIGTLLGADLLNLGKIRGLGAPVASIGGAGKFDGIFMTGLVAVLLAALFGTGRRLLSEIQIKADRQ